MSHIFLFGGVKIGSNTAFYCFVLQRKLIYSIKHVVYEIRRQNVFMYSENTILNKNIICDRTLSPYLKKKIPPHKEVQRIAYRQSTGKSLSEREWVQIISWWYSWVVSFCQFPYLIFVTKFEPLSGLKKIVFQYCVCVRSFEHFCGGRKMVLHSGR